MTLSLAITAIQVPVFSLVLKDMVHRPKYKHIVPTYVNCGRL